MRTIFTIREQNHPDPDALYLDLRPTHRELRYKNAAMQLPLRQFKFMQALMANHPKPMTHWDLFYHVWGEGSSGRPEFSAIIGADPAHAGEDGGPLTPNSCIQQYAAKLRSKLNKIGLTVRSERKGFGYQIYKVENDNEASKETTADTSSQEAQSSLQGKPPKAPRDPTGRTPKQVLKPVGSEDSPTGITLSIERVGVRR